MYGEYKATRKETPSELVQQFGRVRELVQTFKMPIYELEGFEADDTLWLDREPTPWDDL